MKFFIEVKVYSNGYGSKEIKQFFFQIDETFQLGSESIERSYIEMNNCDWPMKFTI